MNFFRKFTLRIRMHRKVDLIIFNTTGSYEIIEFLLKKNFT